ncbi:hypothetical protein BDW62DRAFT_79337 [Aspergillus aurantiobrunneus]
MGRSYRRKQRAAPSTRSDALSHQRRSLMPPSLIYSPPVSVQIRRFIENIYLFFGLYFTSFFAVCLPCMILPRSSSFQPLFSRSYADSSIFSLTRMSLPRTRLSTLLEPVIRTISSLAGIASGGLEGEEVVVAAVPEAAVDLDRSVQEGLDEWMIFKGHVKDHVAENGNDNAHMILRLVPSANPGRVTRPGSSLVVSKRAGRNRTLDTQLSYFYLVIHSYC